jgi:hypothetical protein
MNDKGQGIHPVLHKGFGDTKFKYKTVYPDPPGVKWQALKKLLHKKLAGGDFKTMWKAISSSRVILSKALTEANLNAAFDSTGAVTYAGYAAYQEGTTKDPSDKIVILSSNPHFAQITTELGQKVVDCIDAASEIVHEHGYIPEADYPELLGDADNCPPVTGMALGLMVVNRQRCCILNEKLFEHRRQMKLAAEHEKAGRKRKSGVAGAGAGAEEGGDEGAKGNKKRKTPVVCANSTCMVVQGDEKTGWAKCATKCCRKHFCPACGNQLNAHHTICQQLWQKKQDEKNDAA